jgi:hypothetical protein
VIHHSATSTNKAIGALLAVTVASGAFAAAAFETAPAANATCASFFGIGNGNGCTSSATSIAIAFGAGATADAAGMLGTAIAVGAGVEANTGGTAALAIAFGDNSIADAGTDGRTDIGNIAVNFGANAGVRAVGIGNTAVNIDGDGALVRASGVLNTAVNLNGGNQVTSGLANNSNNIANLAFSLFGEDTKVAAGAGPLAIAGSIFQTVAHITKTGPGLNINGIKVGGAAAPVHHTLSTAAKSSGGAAQRATGSAASSRHVSKK